MKTKTAKIDRTGIKVGLSLDETTFGSRQRKHRPVRYSKNIFAIENVLVAPLRGSSISDISSDIATPLDGGLKSPFWRTVIHSPQAKRFEELKAAYGLLKRLNKESVDPRLRLLKILRSPVAGDIFRALSASAAIEIQGIVVNEEALRVVNELVQLEKVELRNGVLSLTKSGSETVQALRLDSTNVA